MRLWFKKNMALSDLLTENLKPEGFIFQFRGLGGALSTWLSWVSFALFDMVIATSELTI